MFPAFPGGRSGIALLALRAALGVTLILQGVVCIASSGTRSELWIGSIALAAGILLTAGFLTLMVAPLIGLGAAASAFFLESACLHELVNGKSSVAFAAVILAAVFLLGPGAFSVDARVFGRREIIIPPISSSRT